MVWQVEAVVLAQAIMEAMTAPPHATVLAEEAVSFLTPGPGRVIVDGTLGAGGHTEALCETGAQIVAIDRDQSALEIAAERLGTRDNLKLVHSTFSDIGRVLDDLGLEKVDGLLLDLGVSSMQLDRGERGFSFQREGPIDMRMDPTTGPTALDLLREWTPEQIADVLFRYGDERFSRRIAARLKSDARAGALASTLDLAKAVEDEIPAKAKRFIRVHPATKTFQALRIAVNGELEQLETFLSHFPEWLKPGGRCAIISFHSLEDRLVKNTFRDLAKTSSLPRHLAEQAGERTDPVCHVITRKPVIPTDEEIARNPRARSAKLRVCERADA